MQIFSDESNLYIKFSMAEKILSVHGSFTIPLAEISEIHTRIPTRSYKQLRIPGTFIPGLIQAGTYFTKRGWEFWYDTKKKKFLTFELKKGFYKRIILSVDENQHLDIST